jgi:hypothetical protein
MWFLSSITVLTISRLCPAHSVTSHYCSHSPHASFKAHGHVGMTNPKPMDRTHHYTMPKTFLRVSHHEVSMRIITSSTETNQVLLSLYNGNQSCHTKDLVEHTGLSTTQGMTYPQRCFRRKAHVILLLTVILIIYWKIKYFDKWLCHCHQTGINPASYSEVLMPMHRNADKSLAL